MTETSKGEFEPEVLFEDTHLLVLNKPAGMLSQGDKSGELSAVDWFRDYVGRHYAGLIHRLDRNASGALVIAKRSKAAGRLSACLADGTMKRTYCAWLVGDLTEEASWKHWLTKDKVKNSVLVSNRKQEGAKAASLSVYPVARGKWKTRLLTLARFHLETGRSHQIRAQAAAENLPVLGDFKYGRYCNEKWNRSYGRLALHCMTVTFPHPKSGKILEVEAPLPVIMSRLEMAN